MINNFVIDTITIIITSRAKLLNTDWPRRRAFFRNFCNCPGQNYLILIGRTVKLLVSDWLSALHLVGFMMA